MHTSMRFAPICYDLDVMQSCSTLALRALRALLQPWLQPLLSSGRLWLKKRKYRYLM